MSRWKVSHNVIPPMKQVLIVPTAVVVKVEFADTVQPTVAQGIVLPIA